MHNKKVVLFLNENPLPSVFTKGTIAGKELRLRAALEEIDEVHVVSLPGKSVQLPDQTITALEKKIYVHLTPPWPYYGAWFILFLWGLYYAIRLKPISIEAESPILSGPAAVSMGKLLQIPVIVEVRASYEKLIKVKLVQIPWQWKLKLLSAILRYSYTNACAVIANSHTYEKQLHAMGYSSTVINPGLQYAPEAKEVMVKDHVIGYIGRLAPEKGVLHLIEAISLIKDELIQHQWSIHIVGDGVLRNEVEKLAGHLRESGLRVLVMGFQSSYAALQKISILVNPCYVFPPLEMVNAEAAYMGVPVITYGTDSIPETVKDGHSGIVVKEINPKSLAQAISLLVRAEKLRKRYEVQAKETVARDYDFNTQVKKLRELYSSIDVIND